MCDVSDLFTIYLMCMMYDMHKKQRYYYWLLAAVVLSAVASVELRERRRVVGFHCFVIPFLSFS